MTQLCLLGLSGSLHPPESARALRSAIETSDGVIMISPEYNHGMSGVLKNGLDWASRPYGRLLTGKPVLDDDGLARLHRQSARAAANKRSTYTIPARLGSGRGS